ncbi:MFS transporter [Novosphingobium sp.]|uniref:MFS transporter n=1 Tax=Novosphingobium sp. TaxID=1874826 RepID=UPI003BAD6414
MNPAATSITQAGLRASATRMIAGGMLGNMVSVNTALTFTFGIFISTLHAAYGWSRADIAVAMTCFTLVAFLGSSLIGRASDLGDPRRIAVMSFVAFGFALMLLPLFVRSVQSLWLAYTLVAILGLGTSPVVINRPLVAAFSRHRGLAIALALTGSGIGGFVLPQVAAALIARGDWRSGYTGLGALALIAAPAVWFLLGKSAPAMERAGGPRASDRSVRLGDVARSRVFWILSGIALCGGLGMSGPAAHLVPMLGDQGLDAQTAARLAAVIGLASVIGRLLTGAALDRFDTPLPGVPLLALGAAGVGILSHPDLHTAVPAIAMLGFVIGAELAMLAYYSSRYFGLGAHATIFGWTYGMVSVGSAIGPVLVGALRDGQGDYRLGFALSAGALGLSSFLCVLLGPYPLAVKADDSSPGG